MKKIVFLVLIMSSLTSLGQSVNILEEFKNLSEHYAKLESFSLDISVKYYDESGKQLIEQKGHVLHGKNLHYLEMAGHITLVNDQNYLSVDKDYKTVVFNEFKKRSNQSKNENQQDISAVLDSLWSNQEEFKYQVIQSNSNELRVLILDNSNEYYDSYEITVNRKKNQLKELVYYYKVQDEPQYVQQVRIQYTNETNRPKLNARHLRVSSYVVKRKGNWQPADEYRDYHFIDQTKTQINYE